MNRIKELRLAKKMKQTDLANVLSVSQAALSGYETGKYEPDFDTLKKIADFFGVTTDYLLGNKKTPAIETDDGQAKKLAKALLDIGIDVNKLSDAEINRVARIAAAALKD